MTMLRLAAEVIRVAVDSGTIELSSTGDLEKAGDVYRKGQDLACWTADAIWNGRTGGVGTPSGDGPHEVCLRVYESYEEYRKESGEEYQRRKTEPKEKDLASTTLAWRRPDEKPMKGYRLYVGDCGNVYGSLAIPMHHGLIAVWLDHGTLEIQVVP